MDVGDSLEGPVQVADLNLDSTSTVFVFCSQYAGARMSGFLQTPS